MEKYHVTATIAIKCNKVYAVLSWYENGARKRKWQKTGLNAKSGKKVQRAAVEEARRAMEQQLNEIAEKQAMVSILAGHMGDMLFADYMLYWLAAIKGTVAENTYENYEIVIKKKIEPYFRAVGVTLAEVRTEHLQFYYKKRMEEDKVSGNTIRHDHAYIHSALNYAVRHQYIPFNPAIGVTLPKKQHFETTPYKPEEVKRLLLCAKGTLLEAPVTLGAFYGVRRSESTGLTWDAVDFEHETITINQKVYESHDADGKPILVVSHDLKTESSRRTLPLMPYVKEFLLSLQAKQAENRRLLGNAYNDTYKNFICVTERGDLIKPNYLTTAFKKLLEKNGLPQIRFHDLRHTCASLLLSKDVNMKEIQIWLGHSNFATTSDIYSHLNYSDKQKAAQVINDLLE